jgi:hypothetical protein
MAHAMVFKPRAATESHQCVCHKSILNRGGLVGNKKSLGMLMDGEIQSF